MSFWCAAALMRVIQRRRNSRFFALRSRYAYFQPRSTFSFAAFHSLLRPPNAPRAAFMICFFRFRRGTFDRARGIVSLPPLVLKQPLDVLDLALRRDKGAAAKPTLSLRVLLRKDVALERAHALDLAGACDLEALLRALVCFHFHRYALISAPKSSSLTSLPAVRRSRSCRCRRDGSRRDRARPVRAPGGRPAG